LARATTVKLLLPQFSLPFLSLKEEDLASSSQGTKGRPRSTRSTGPKQDPIQKNPASRPGGTQAISKQTTKVQLQPSNQEPAKTEALPAPIEDRPFDRKVYGVRTTTRRLRTGPLIRIEDSRLVELVLQGSEPAYNELVERYQNTARNRALAVVRDYQAAEDIVQDAFIKAYNALATLADPRRFSGWLFTIVQHTALDLVRSRKENMSLETMREQGFEAPRDSRGLQIEKLEEREDDLKLLDTLGQMRSDYMEIIVLKHVDKLSYKEIAERLNMSVSAVGEKLSRVRGILKRKLEKKQSPLQLSDDQPE
jgi:RNA polymerase sigma-70 factor (ECF subfamily)